MQRSIKFRAWDKKQEVMIPNDQVMHLEFNKEGIVWLGCWVVVADSQGNPEQGLHQIEKEDLELMQFTGLKDKNGREIYEGDIFDCIYHFDGCKKHKLEVVYSDEGARFQMKSYGKCHQPNVEKYIWDMTRQEIIGNVYENPELLRELSK